MISKLSKLIVSFLTNRDILNEEDFELYQYGFFILLSKIFFFLIAIILGFILGVIVQSIVFYLLFVLIRQYAGGYHASNEITCDLLTTFSICISLLIIKVSTVLNLEIPVVVFSLFAALCIIALCPLDTPEKPLTNKERQYFRKISWLILLMILALILITYIFSFKFILVPSCLSLILESVLLAAGKIKSINKRDNQE